MVVSHDMRLTYGYDNINEGIVDPVHAQVARLLVSRGRPLGIFRRAADIGDLPGRGQAPLRLSEADVTSQFINEGTVGYQRRVRKTSRSRGSSDQDRAWTDGFFFINEDGFTRVSGSFSGLLNLEPLSGDELSTLELGARYSDTDFENLDSSFGNHIIGAYAAVSRTSAPT